MSIVGKMVSSTIISLGFFLVIFYYGSGIAESSDGVYSSISNSDGQEMSHSFNIMWETLPPGQKSEMCSAFNKMTEDQIAHQMSSSSERWTAAQFKEVVIPTFRSNCATGV